MTVKEVYIALRKANPSYPAKHALSMAKAEAAREPIEWEERRGAYHATVKRGLFTVTLRAEPDSDLDAIECRELGRYTNDWSKGCIDLVKSGDYRGRGHYRYWKPENPEYRNQDYAIVKAVENGSAACFHVTAKVAVDGIELAKIGTGTGVCLARDESERKAMWAYLTDTAHEAIREAVAEAEDRIKRIKAL